MGQRLADEDDHEHRWMVEHCKNPEVAALLPDLTVGTLRILDVIGRLEPVNGKQVFDIHRAMHVEMKQRMTAFCGVIQPMN